MPGNTVAELRSMTRAVRRNGNTGSDVRNAIASDDDHLIVQQRAGSAVEHPARANGDDLRRRSEESRRCPALRMHEHGGKKDHQADALQMLHGWRIVVASRGI
jgi:hypothetical protein